MGNAVMANGYMYITMDSIHWIVNDCMIVLGLGEQKKGTVGFQRDPLTLSLVGF